MPRLHDSDGTPLRLGTPLGRGGEGTVYALEGAPQLAAKVLHAPARRRDLHEKLRAMIRQPPPGARDRVWGFPILTWPGRILYDDPRARSFAGYTMPRIEPRDFLPLYQILSSERRRRIGAPLAWDHLVLLGLRITHVVRTLHRFRYAVGDLNDRNLLVSRRLTPLFLDTDSFQVPRGWFGHYACRVGDRLYWPPELLGTDLATYTGTREGADSYALAVVLFQLFLDGMRPHQARGRIAELHETLEAKTLAGLYPWDQPRRGRLEPPRGAPRYDLLPERLRQGFERAFVKGHDRPRARPTADEWHRTLRGILEEGFQTCPRRPLHHYSERLTRCPWCQDRNDPFRP